MLKHFAILCICLLGCVSAQAQGTHWIDQAIGRAPTGNGAQVIPYAKVLVCVAGTACGQKATVYSNIGLTSVAQNPVVADANGNYDYYVPAACYDEQITAPGTVTQQIFNVCTGGVGSFLPLAGGTLVGPLTAPGFVGPLTGNVTGTASGNLVANPTISQPIVQPTGTSFSVSGTAAINNPTFFGTNPFVGFANTLGGSNIAGISASPGVFNFGNGASGDTSAAIYSAIANGSYYPLQYAGGDLCAQMTSAISAMPATGGVLDISGLAGVSPTTCSSNPFAGVTKPLLVKLGPGKINTTAQWYVHSSMFKLQGAGMGNTQLIYTGTNSLKDPGGVNPGGVLELDSTAPATVFNYGDSVSDMSIVGNANAPYAMLVDGTHHSMFRNLAFWGSATCGYESKFAVVNDMDNLHVSGEDASFYGLPGTAPANGICLDGENLNAATTASTITNPLVEGVAVCGIELDFAGGNTFLSGTSEFNGTSGNTSSANLCLAVGSTGNNPFHNTFNGLDLEGANNADILDYGADNQFINVLGTTASTFAGTNANIEGGQIEHITIAPTASYTRLLKVRAAAAPVDNGTATAGTIYGEVQNRLWGFPWSYRDTTFGGTYSTSPTGPFDGEDFLRGVYGFTTTPTVLSNTALTVGKPWMAIFHGQWENSVSGSGQAQLPAILVLSSTNPTFTFGSLSVTFSVNSSGYFQGVASSGTIGFAGTVYIIPANQNSAGTIDAQYADGIQAGSLTVGGGATIPTSDNVVQTTATAPTGTCTPNGYIAANFNGVTVHLATCP